MAIIPISQEEFHSYSNVNNPNRSLNFKEKLWFSDDQNNLISTILLDNFDNDWGFIIMSKDSDGIYRAFEAEDSLESIEKAKALLDVKIATLVENGEYKEMFFDSKLDNSELEKSSLVITDINLELKKYFQKNPKKLYDLNSRKFEELIASIMEDFGFDVELTKATRDGGRDIIASLRNAVTSYLTFVECKKYSINNKVGVQIIREVAGVHNLHKPSKSLIVTTSTFTNDAVKEAKMLNDQIDLKDYYSIKSWLSKY